jgi:rare lipoprotein A
MTVQKELKMKNRLFFLIFYIFLFSCSSSVVSIRNQKMVNDNLDYSKVVEGFASFYADKYQGKKTANGEIFNMNDLTCAHKKLPFNTKLRVTYIKTGLSVIVRVNDRGPYVGDRILDLSLEAAKQIGLYKDGVGKVRIEIL